MPATIQTLPPQVTYANNPILIQLASDLIGSLKSSVKIKFTSIPAEDETLTMIFNNIEYKFTYKSSAVIYPWRIERTTGTVAAFCETAHARLENNAVINDRFNITHGADFIKLEWKDTSKIVTTATTTSAASTLTILQSPGPYQDQNLKAYIELWWSHHNESLEKITAIGAHYNTRTKNTGPIDISELINLTYHLPTIASLNIFKQSVALKSFRKYFLRFADKYGTPAVPEILTKTSEFLAIHGGSSAYNRSAINSIINAPLGLCHNSEGQGAGEVAPFVHPNQPNWLYFYCATDDEQITMTTEIHYQPIGPAPVQTTVAQTILTLPTTKGINYITSGFKQLLLKPTLDPAGNPSHYIVKIQVGTNGIVKRYDLDYDIAEERPYILFDNGLGGMETIYLAGEFSEIYNRKKDTFIHLVEHNGKQQPETGEYNRKGNSTFQVSTGWQKKDYIDTLKQVLLGDAYIIRENRFDKIEILSNSIDPSPQHDFLYALALKFKMATPDEQYNRY